MHRLMAIAVVVAMSLQSLPLFAARADVRATAQDPASLSGTVTTASGQPVPSATVQLRNLAGGQLAGTTTTSANGQFSFPGLNPGNYVVEVVNAAGQIVGTSGAIAVKAGAAVVAATVTTSAVSMAAASGATGAAAASGLSTAAIVGIVAAAVGIPTVVVAVKKSNPSPSK